MARYSALYGPYVCHLWVPRVQLLIGPPCLLSFLFKAYFTVPAEGNRSFLVESCG